MKLIITKLELLNFKGKQGKHVINFDNKLTEITGANGTGKTTIADAINWVLFGKNSTGAADFGIEPKDENQKIIPKLDHEVTLFLLKDNKELTLRRCWDEKWGKPRNQVEEILLRHEARFYINGNKVSFKEYKEFINTIITEKMFKALTSPSYFPSLKAEEQRALLISMTGEIDTAEVAKERQEFSDVLKMIDDQDINKYILSVKNKISAIKNDKAEIDARITEQNYELEGLKEQPLLSKKEIEEEKQKHMAALDTINSQILDNSKIEDEKYNIKREKRREINSLQSKSQALKYEIENQYNAEKRDQENAAARIKERIRQAEQKVLNNKEEIDTINLLLSEQENEKILFRKAWEKLEGETFEIDRSLLICPTCKRELDKDDVENKISEMKANFNEEHVIQEEKLMKRAQQIKMDIEKKEARLQDAKLKSQQAEEELVKIKAEESNNQETIYITPLEERIAQNKELQEIEKDITAKTLELENLEQEKKEDKETQIQNLINDKKEIQKKIDKLNADAFTLSLLTQKEGRIEELKKNLQELNIQMTQLQGYDLAARDFQKACISQLEEKVNKLFTTIKFSMFKEQLDGTIKPTCECTMHGTPFKDLSNGESINAGLEIINVMCQYNNQFPPCIIDNAESINNIMPIESQTILLKVSESKQLIIK